MFVGTEREQSGHETDPVNRSSEVQLQPSFTSHESQNWNPKKEKLSLLLFPLLFRKGVEREDSRILLICNGSLVHRLGSARHAPSIVSCKSFFFFFFFQYLIRKSFYLLPTNIFIYMFTLFILMTILW